ncbi:MAG: hypothetical protein WCG30_04020 [Candidatus Saccharibacteria bacterium]
MKQFVLAITGPTGSGKSTIGEKIAKEFELCVNIDADHIKHMIVSGFYNDSANAGGWSFSQWGLVGDSIGLLASNFANEGYSVVINGYIDEPAWTNIEKLIAIDYKILLLPELEIIVGRDSGRNEEIAMGEASVRQHHEAFSTNSFYQNFHKLDTTSHSIEETIAAIKSLLPPT